MAILGFRLVLKLTNFFNTKIISSIKLTAFGLEQQFIKIDQ